MKVITLIVSMMTFCNVFASATKLIECEGMDNRNMGEVKVILKEGGENKVLVSYYNEGTRFYHLSNVNVDPDKEEIINHTDRNRNVRLVVNISSESLVDGASTIRPFPKRSRVYFGSSDGGKARIHSRYFKCKTYNFY